MRFEGTDTYIATPDLMLAVNAAVTLERRADASSWPLVFLTRYVAPSSTYPEMTPIAVTTTNAVSRTPGTSPVTISPRITPWHPAASRLPRPNTASHSRPPWLA